MAGNNYSQKPFHLIQIRTAPDYKGDIYSGLGKCAMNKAKNKYKWLTNCQNSEICQYFNMLKQWTKSISAGTSSVMQQASLRAGNQRPSSHLAGLYPLLRSLDKARPRIQRETESWITPRSAKKPEGSSPGERVKDALLSRCVLSVWISTPPPTKSLQ